MPYVKRDAGGGIVAVSQAPEAGCLEAVAADDEQLQQFLDTLAGNHSELRASDQDFVRVLEDVVDLLMDKGVILFTELPASAQDKIMLRQRLRSELGSALDLLGDD
tara:strand:+ start:518 stop:835 length:318 start_codon:yes stop_codon:yes gene_type:complete